MTANSEKTHKIKTNRSARISFFWGPPVYGTILRRLEVMLDGAPLGKIRMMRFGQFHIEPGAHTMYVHIEKQRSPELAFEIADGETMRFNCRFNKGIESSVSSLQRLIKPDEAFILEEYQAGNLTH